jgi:hypothetical protein
VSAGTVPAQFLGQQLVPWSGTPNCLPWNTTAQLTFATHQHTYTYEP